MEFYTTSELYHHGILGMKWGVRRYQNKDGSLTEAGKKHYRDYTESNRRFQKVDEEGKKLFSKGAGKKDFASWEQIDDIEYAEYLARTEYGKAGKAFVDAYDNWNSHLSKNRESIEQGRKIAQKLKLPSDVIVENKKKPTPDWVLTENPPKKTPNWVLSENLTERNKKPTPDWVLSEKPKNNSKLYKYSQDILNKNRKGSNI